jgi:hypothetical protein
MKTSAKEFHEPMKRISSGNAGEHHTTQSSNSDMYDNVDTVVNIKIM